MAITANARKAIAALAVSAAGLAFITGNEGGAVQRAYPDSIGKPTICVGHTAGVKLGMYYTLEQCAQLLREDSDSAQYAVRKAIKVPLYQYEFDALVDFCFNVGNYNCSTSTMFKMINAGNYDLAALQFRRWKFAGGLDCTVRANNCWGVWQRRLDEERLFRTGAYD